MDLTLNTQTHDLEVNSYDLSLNTGLPLMQQRLRQSLWFFLGEWYLDVTDGVPYYQDVLIKAPVQLTLESTFKQAILETPGVLNLEKFELEYTNATRELALDFEAQTFYGNTAISEVI